MLLEMRVKRMMLIKKTRGMMLIELMISLVIFTTLSITVFRFSHRALIDKSMVERRIYDRSQKDRIQKLMQSDIYQTFDFKDINFEIYSKVQEDRSRDLNDLWKKIQDKQANEYEKFYGPENKAEYLRRSANFAVPSYKKLTHYLGKKDSMHFTTSNHVRLIKDSAVSNIVEVGYFLRKCKSVDKKTTFSSCLWRRSSAIIDDDVSKGGVERVVLEGVKKFQISYTQRISQDSSGVKADWKDEWISDYRGKSSTRGKFPLAVLIFLSWERKQKERGKEISKTFSLNFVTPLMLASLLKQEKNENN